MVKKLTALAAFFLLVVVITSVGYAGEKAGPAGNQYGSAYQGSNSSSSDQEGLQIRESTQNSGDTQQLNVQNQTGGNAENGNQTDACMENARLCLQSMQRDRLMTGERWQELNSYINQLREQIRTETRNEAKEQIKNLFRECYTFANQQNNTEESLNLLRDLIGMEPANPENYQELGTIFQYMGENSPSLFCRGSEIVADVPAVIKDGRTLVPVRSLSEALNAEVQWNEAEQTVYINRGEDIKIRLQVNNRVALVNGEEITLEVPAEIHNSRVLVPVRFIAESLKAEVKYYPVGQIITIN
jgi:hypothetical protein